MCTSAKVLLAAFVVCCVLAESCGAINCLWTDKDGKEQKVNCTDSKYCFKVSGKSPLDGKEFKNHKGCAGKSQYDLVLLGPNGSNSTTDIPCSKDGDVNVPNNPLLESLSCCSGKDYCNSAGRSGITLGLLSVVVASLMAKTVV